MTADEPGGTVLTKMMAEVYQTWSLNRPRGTLQPLLWQMLICPGTAPGPLASLRGRKGDARGCQARLPGLEGCLRGLSFGGSLAVPTTSSS
jgi:hypothetical protein